MKTKAKRKTDHRRRGTLLEEAILAAAWEELVENGYVGFTADGVAKRAATSRTVLNRRWANKVDLATAAIVRHLEQHRISAPDTGSIREDLAFVLKKLSAKVTRMAGVILLQMTEYFIEANSSLADLRRQLNAGSILEPIYLRAATRGEIDPRRLTPRIASLPLDLLRHEVASNLKPVSEKTIYEIIDEVFLPLVAVKTPAK